MKRTLTTTITVVSWSEDGELVHAKTVADLVAMWATSDEGQVGIVNPKKATCLTQGGVTAMLSVDFTNEYSDLEWADTTNVPTSALVEYFAKQGVKVQP